MKNNKTVRQAGPNNRSKFSAYRDGVYETKGGKKVLFVGGVPYAYDHKEGIIGKGSFGEVYQSADKKHAIKVFTKENFRSSAYFEKIVTTEKKLLQHLGLYLTTTKKVASHGTEALLPMPYYDGENLEDFLKSQAGAPIYKLLNVMLLTCLEIYKLHLQGIVHRDIKTDNLIYRAKENKVTAIDFSVSVTDKDDSSYYCGTPFYMSPEAVCNVANDQASDYFSLSRVLAKLADYQLVDSHEVKLSKAIPKPENIIETNEIVQKSFELFIRQLTKAPSDTRAQIINAYNQMSDVNYETFHKDRRENFKLYDFIILLNDAANQCVASCDPEAQDPVITNLKATTQKINNIHDNKESFEQKIKSRCNKRKLQLESRVLLEKMYLFNNNLIAVMEDKLNDTHDINKKNTIKSILGQPKQAQSTNTGSQPITLYSIRNKIKEIKARKIKVTDAQAIYSDLQNIKQKLQTTTLNSESNWHRIIRFFSDGMKRMFDKHTSILSSQYIYSTSHTLTRLGESIDKKCCFFQKRHKKVLSNQDAPANCPKPNSN